MNIKNILVAIKDQGPLTRFIRNFFITRNAWGLFHINSHVNQATGKEKVAYGSKASAVKASQSMSKKTGKYFSTYKCMFCEGFHVGKNRDNK